MQSNIRSQELTFVKGPEPPLYHLNGLCSENPEVTLTHRNQSLLTDSIGSSYKFTLSRSLRAIPNNSSQLLHHILSSVFLSCPILSSAPLLAVGSLRSPPPWRVPDRKRFSLPSHHFKLSFYSRECSSLSHHYSCKW